MTWRQLLFSVKTETLKQSSQLNSNATVLTYDAGLSQKRVLSVGLPMLSWKWVCWKFSKPWNLLGNLFAYSNAKISTKLQKLTLAERVLMWADRSGCDGLCMLSWTLGIVFGLQCAMVTEHLLSMLYADYKLGDRVHSKSPAFIGLCVFSFCFCFFFCFVSF